MMDERAMAIQKMVNRIGGILQDCSPSIYLYGSSTVNDFRLGWSDIDILVLNGKRMSGEQAERLVGLRQEMLAAEPDNLYYRSFEGGMLTLEAFAWGKSDLVVYWGTSGERITNTYVLDSFCMTELIENGILLYGEDMRPQLKAPDWNDLYADVERHYKAIREYARETERSIYSFGWLLDIARCIYTLRTGKIIAKTEAAEWALKNDLCPDAEVLQYALQVRKCPLNHRDKRTFDYAETLAEPIQRFADVLERELKVTMLQGNFGNYFRRL